MAKYGRILLSIGFLSAPFAGPGSAVLTSAGWLLAGSEEHNSLWGFIGLVGLMGIAAILAAKYGVLGGIAGLGGVLLLTYEALAVAALWHAGSKYGSILLKAAAIMLAVSWLIAVTAAPSSVETATRTASGALVDWAGTAWASQAAHSLIARIGGPQVLAQWIAAAAAILAGVGILLAPATARAEAQEESIFALNVY